MYCSYSFFCLLALISRLRRQLPPEGEAYYTAKKNLIKNNTEIT